MGNARELIEATLVERRADVGQVAERFGVLQVAGRWKAQATEFVLRAWLDESIGAGRLHFETACWKDDEEALERRVILLDGTNVNGDELLPGLAVGLRAVHWLVDAIVVQSQMLAKVEPISLPPRPAFPQKPPIMANDGAEGAK